MSAQELPYFKMNGAGNSILVVDARGAESSLAPQSVRGIARESRFAFDQLMLIEAPHRPAADAFVRIFNADGSESGACGNGTRCVAWVLLHRSDASELIVETIAGDLPCVRLASTRFAVDMGAPRLGWADIPLSHPFEDTGDVRLAAIAGLPERFSACAAVSMGNPHAVFFVPDAGAIALAEIGPIVEHHPAFPQRTNVSFAEVIDPGAITLRVWERSAGATLACGSAACATAVAAVRAGLTGRSVRVALPGGALDITWRQADGHVVMAGGVELEHAGVLPPHLWMEPA